MCGEEPHILNSQFLQFNLSDNTPFKKYRRILYLHICKKTPTMGNDQKLGAYYAPKGGLPPQTQILTDRAMFTEAYAVIPKGTFSDIVTSFLPFWDKTRLWVIARPLSGFAETFSQYIMEVQPGGGSDRGETDDSAQGVVFVVEGEVTITLGLSLIHI